ncbi:MAG: PP2C family serine/threonine-protein phosphatase [Legionellaceae bacterium]|nr:PP2C family serine/threonine-protein phosphatase [Legionellaceae bacterium]
MHNKRNLIISTPSMSDATYQTDDNFGAFETIGLRDEQEDTLVRKVFVEDELKYLTPEQIGERLWTVYHLLNNGVGEKSGTTASTTVIKGHYLITATLADTVAFASIWGKDKHLLGVTRLNNRTHSPKLSAEKERIERLGGSVIDGRVSGSLAVSRAIGDKSYAPFLIADADINTTSIDILAYEMDINIDDIVEVKIITTCDGFTEPVVDEKIYHEEYLANCLRNEKYLECENEFEEAKYLAQVALNPENYTVEYNSIYNCRKGSFDNISVAIQTIPIDVSHDYACMIGVYDGHGGVEASTYVANNISREFIFQCKLSEEEYAAQEYGVRRERKELLTANPAPRLYTIFQEDCDSNKPQDNELVIITQSKNK